MNVLPLIWYVSGLYPRPPVQQVQGQGRQGKDKQQDDDESDMDADVGDAQDAVAEGVHHVQYGIGQGDRSPETANYG